MSTKNVSRSIWRKVQKMPSVEGVFGINKPTGLSSAQVLRDCQKVFHDSKLFAPHLRDMKAQLLRDNHNQRQRRKVKDPKVKIGHGGTLDPLATGILIAGIGTGTKKHITKEMVEKALDQFRGKFMQLPPLFSALKMNGKPLYEYARENKPIPRDIERRPVEVEELEMLEWMEPGTHNHKPPTDEAGHAEINLAKLVWKQESILPPKSPESEKVAKENFEDKKRKMSENQDELVQERPKSKRKTDAVKTESDPDAEPVMSGGLPEPVASTEVAAKVPDATVESVEAAPESPKSLGPPAARIRMTVTSGFYVRSLCHDLGVAVGSAALMAELERTRQGQFSVGNDNVLEYDDLSKGEEVWAPKLESMIKAWENKTEATKAEAGAEAKSEAPVKEEVSGDAVKMEDAQAKFTEAAEQLAEEVKSEGESPSKVFEAAA
ncbi:putative tRNA pseudouridine synthase 4 [Glarea lozoyensis 74030]|uniref:tRNA pseudouridine(55) synthase n=1 Tax=Glarea lozoyensis (strain ATCC 74030 / MF5533) TaxID=1104152 RepID=H0EPY2_GLAL7|nr:putative tRNA pseudouridine synthase 4 [Glarea lozoyensis 74030]